MFDEKMINYLVCPISKQKLEFDKANNRLVSHSANLAYPIIDGMPILLADQAIKLKKD
jgi:hypothetical protein